MSTMFTEKDENVEPTCPFCGSTNVERESAFGSEISKSQYYCNGCSTMFERIKFDGKRPNTGR
jgi:transposase-like protein